MGEKSISISGVLQNEIHNQTSIFVFPTQTAANLWADRATQITSAKAVAMERFIAWDDFKSSAVRTQMQKKTSVPSTIRDLFAAKIVEKNAASPFFKNIIVPQYAKSASSFASWISSLLPSLALWKKKFAEAETTMSIDDEDSDFLKLYELYSEFLDSHNLFDPAWETPPFQKDGNRYFIFYPEILSDYTEYKNILESSPDSITLIHAPDPSACEKNPAVYFYSNSRTEIRKTALYLKHMHDNKHIAWTDMALSTKDMETWSPYIEQEFTLRHIPFVQRNGKPLTSYGAGNFFVQIQNCVYSDFSYESIKNLLLNQTLPWTNKSTITNLITFGRQNNTICSYTYNDKKQDVWENAFSAPYTPEREDSVLDEGVKNLYRLLKKTLSAMVNAKTFAEIRTEYFKFRHEFFDQSLWTEESDTIVSRCIAELGGLIDLEEEYSNLAVESPYAFFVKYLADKMYLAQSAQRGVNILPYRLSCCAPYKVQVILDASQSALSVIYRQLSFLSDDKRAKFGFASDPDVSNIFIRLYADSATEETRFSCSEKTFTGYAIPHSYLEETDLTKSTDREDSLDKHDTYMEEKKFILPHIYGQSEASSCVTEIQKNAFESWKSLHQKETSVSQKGLDDFYASVNSRVMSPKLCISYSSLKRFYTCPRSWIFQRGVNLQEENSEAELVNSYAQGNLRHSILENFCNELLKLDAPLCTTETGLSEEYILILNKSVEHALQTFKCSTIAKDLLLTTKHSILESMKQSVEKFSTYFAGFKVYAMEQDYKFEEEDKNYFYYGRVDCILKDDDANLVIVDFKSSESSIPNKSFYVSDDVQVPDFQMPMYKFLLEKQKIPQTVENCAFFDIQGGKLHPVTGEIVLACAKRLNPRANYKTEDFVPTQNAFVRLSEEFAQICQNHDFSINNFDIDWNTCKTCAYKAICRRTFAVGNI